MLEIISEALPVLVRVTVWALLVPTIWGGKVNEEGAKLTAGGVPVPLKLTIWVLPATSWLLSVIVRVPVRVPTAVGVKVTLIEHVFVPEAGTGVATAQVVEGSSAKSPLRASALRVKLLVPVLVSVTD
jgi:hypothetical protein